VKILKIVQDQIERKEALFFTTTALAAFIAAKIIKESKRVSNTLNWKKANIKRSLNVLHY